jgi:hypothetical protein
MKNTDIMKIILTFALWSVFAFCYGQSIMGNVTDKNTNEPVNGAEIFIRGVGGSIRITVDASGFYMIETSPGPYKIFCSLDGYNTWSSGEFELKGNEIKFLDIQLKPLEAEPDSESVDSEKAIDNEKSGKHQQKEIKIKKSEDWQAGAKKHQLFPDALVAIGIGYQLGQIGGITVNADLSLSNLIVRHDIPTHIFFSVKYGTQKASYSSFLFNDNSRYYEFSFSCWMIGVKKIFDSGSFLIIPEIFVGKESAKPLSEDVHEKVDGGKLRGSFVAPAATIGYVISPNLTANITASWYFMMNETRNEDNKILAEKIPNSNSWSSWSYAEDFFQNRKGFSVLTGLTYFF